MEGIPMEISAAAAAAVMNDILFCKIPDAEGRFREWYKKVVDASVEAGDDNSLYWDTNAMKKVFVDHYNSVKAVPFFGAGLEDEK
jgi:hypothetical protein